MLAALLAIVGVGFYYYSKLNDEIRQRVQAKFAAHYQNLNVNLRSARLIDGQGIEIRGLSISDPNLTGPQAELIYFDEIFLYCDTSLQELIQHEPQITRMAIRRPRIQATRLPNGTWSVAKLFPLPKFSDRPPDMSVEGAQVSVVDASRQTPATFNLRDINLAVIPQPAPNPAQQTVCTVKGTLAADHVQHIEIDGLYDKSTNRIDLNGSVNGIDICPELLAVLPANLAEHTKPLSPLRGQAGLKFSVRHMTGWTQPQFQVDGRLASARFDAPELPQSLPNIEATFHANNNGLVVDEFKTNNGPTKISLSASMNGFHAGAPIRVQGNAEHLLIGRQWEALFSPNILNQWRKFLPAGEVSVKDIDLSFDGTRWRTNARVECIGVSFAFYRFPYRLQQGSGVVALKDKKIEINLTAYAGSRPVAITGEFQNPGPDFTGWAKIEGREFPIDQTLYGAMCEAQPVSYEKPCRIVQSLNPMGTFDLTALFERTDPRSPMHKELHVTLNRCSMCYEKFRYPLSNVVGQIDVVDNLWTFRNFEGTNDTGRVRCNGSLTQLTDGAGAQLRLNFAGDDIVLEDELRDALNPNIQRLWNDLKPRGSIKLVSADVNYQTGDSQPSVEVTVSPVNDSVSIHPSFFPYRLEQMKGQITFSNGRADFTGIQAIHNRTQISANGFCEHSGNGPWHVQFKDFAVDQIRLDQDPDLLLALPTTLRKAVAQLKPTGMLCLRGTLDLWGEPCIKNDVILPLDAPPSCNVRIGWTDMEIDMQQGSLQTGVVLNNVLGRVILSGMYDALQPVGRRLQCRGALDVDSVSWNGFQFTGVHGPMWLDDQQVILGSHAEPNNPNRLPQHLSAQCYGGTVLADTHVTLAETPRFSLQATVSGTDLARFCTEALPGRQNLRGKVLASIDLYGNAAGLHTLSGRGEMRLSDADIYELPVMMRLLKVLKMRPPDTTAFTNSKVLFRVEGDHVLMDYIDFSGEVISLVGEGDMNLNTAIDLRLNSVLGRTENQLPFLTMLARSASSQIVEFHVTGTLADPQVHREAFPTVSQALQTLQAGMQPLERPLLPQGMRSPAGTSEPQRR